MNNDLFYGHLDSLSAPLIHRQKRENTPMASLDLLCDRVLNETGRSNLNMVFSTIVGVMTQYPNQFRPLLIK